MEHPVLLENVDKLPMNSHVKQHDGLFFKKVLILCELCLKEDISWPEAEKINVCWLSSKSNLAHGNIAVIMYIIST